MRGVNMINHILHMNENIMQPVILCNQSKHTFFEEVKRYSTAQNTIYCGVYWQECLLDCSKSKHMDDIFDEMESTYWLQQMWLHDSQTFLMTKNQAHWLFLFLIKLQIIIQWFLHI